MKELIQLIFDVDQMKNQLVEIGYDEKKLPLGKLSRDTIQKGYAALKKISVLIGTEGSKSYKNDDLHELCEDFYSLIPHDFGFKKMYNFVINTPKLVKSKLVMLESLMNIQIANKLLEGGLDTTASQLDQNYQSLNCDIEPLDK